MTTLTKRLAEDLSHYMGEVGLKCKYLHSEIQTFDRVEILRELREGGFDVLIGVNLLREGLDLPEVSLVGDLDAGCGQAGGSRSETSLIQMIGRCARNVEAQVFLYADVVTPSMKRAMDETNRRRGIQEAYNTENNITPTTIQKAIRHGIDVELKAWLLARREIARAVGGGIRCERDAAAVGGGDVGGRPRYSNWSLRRRRDCATGSRN